MGTHHEKGLRRLNCLLMSKNFKQFCSTIFKLADSFERPIKF